MTLVKARPKGKTRQQLVAEMSEHLNQHLASLPPEEAEGRLLAAEKAAAAAKSSRRKSGHTASA